MLGPSWRPSWMLEATFDTAAPARSASVTVRFSCEADASPRLTRNFSTVNRAWFSPGPFEPFVITASHASKVFGAANQHFGPKELLNAKSGGASSPRLLTARGGVRARRGISWASSAAPST